MVDIIQQTRDRCVDELVSTEGESLEITANLVNSGQMAAVMEGYVSSTLGSRYGRRKYEMLLRLTVSWRGRARDDLTDIGKTPEVGGWQPQTSGRDP